MNKKILVLCTTLIATPLRASSPTDLAQLYGLVALCAAAYVAGELRILQPKINPFGNALEHAHYKTPSRQVQQPLLPIHAPQKKKH